MAYTGSVELISGIVQKNNGSFPLVDATAVRVTDNERLDTKISGMENDISDKIGNPSTKSTGDFLVYNGIAWVAQSLSTWQGGSY